MAATVTINHRSKLSNRWANLCTVLMDSSYASGGEAITANACGLSRIDEVIINSQPSGYKGEWDQANLKIKVDRPEAIKSVQQVVTKAAATDNTDATGYMDFTDTIPAGSIILGWEAVTSVAWTGDTSAVIQVGVAGDLDRFSAQTTGSVFSTGTVGSGPLAADVLDTPTGAITPRVTITGGSDFTALNASASTTVNIFFLDPTNMAATEIDEILAGTSLAAVTFRITAIGI